MQTNIDGIRLYVDATNGKLANNGSCAQFNTGTKLQVPVVSTNDVVTVVANSYNFVNIKIGGTVYTTLSTQYTATSTDVTNGYVEVESTNSPYINSIQVVQNEPSGTPAAAYTHTWQFGKSNGAEEFALEKSTEYTYTVNEHSLVVNTDAGKLNNATRNDKWAQCNNGTLFKVPVFAGAKLSWEGYNNGSETGFTIGDKLYNGYYIATEEGTVNMTATGISYLSFIKIEPVTLFEVTGTITGGTINGATITLTAAGNGHGYDAVIADGAFPTKR